MVSRLREIEVSAAATKRLMDQNDTMLEELRKVKLAHEAATSKPRRSWKSASIDEPLTTGFANHILKRKRRPRRLPALGQDPSPPSRAGRPSTSTSSETAVEHVDESALRRREAVSQRGELAVRTSDATQEKDGEEPEKEMSFTAAGCLLDGALDDRHEAARFAQAVEEWRSGAAGRIGSSFWTSRNCGGPDYKMPGRLVKKAMEGTSTDASSRGAHWCCYYCMRVHLVIWVDR
ncbi:hypothetical protein FOZ61_002204 [Perkinsus olseni]|uniref:Uncharacterized protein n=1 Tax=Perkinsus olseni TaxID=32597 RepID=A0A7J6MEI8_PEROL|nr:hypothetical protein FOZ61_002204 [Perkinsus olseni]